MHCPRTAARSVTTMDATLIHGDDDSCREIDRLIAEVSSELCLLGDGDLDALIASTIARIGDAAGADALTLIAYRDVDTPARTHRCERPPLGEKIRAADPAHASPLWERTPLGIDPAALEV